MMIFSLTVLFCLVIKFKFKLLVLVKKILSYSFGTEYNTASNSRSRKPLERKKPFFLLLCTPSLLRCWPLHSCACDSQPSRDEVLISAQFRCPLLHSCGALLCKVVVSTFARLWRPPLFAEMHRLNVLPVDSWERRWIPPDQWDSRHSL